MKIDTAAVIAAVVVAALSGCAGGPRLPQATETGPGQSRAGQQVSATGAATSGTGGQGLAAGQDGCWHGEGPSAVVDQVAARLWAWDTRTDTSSAQAAARVGAHLSARVLQEYTAVASTDAQWAQMAAHGGYVVAAVSDIGQWMDLPSDGDLVAVRARGVGLSPIGGDGWAGQELYVVATFHLTRSACTDRWVVDQIDTSWASTTTGDLDVS